MNHLFGEEKYNHKFITCKTGKGGDSICFCQPVTCTQLALWIPAYPTICNDK